MQGKADAHPNSVPLLVSAVDGPQSQPYYGTGISRHDKNGDFLCTSTGFLKYTVAVDERFWFHGVTQHRCINLKPYCSCVFA